MPQLMDVNLSFSLRVLHFLLDSFIIRVRTAWLHVLSLNNLCLTMLPLKFAGYSFSEDILNLQNLKQYSTSDQTIGRIMFEILRG